MKTTLLKDQAETLLLLDLTNYHQTLKTPKRKQCQIAANCTQKKPAKFLSNATKLYVVSVPPRSMPNALYVRQHKYETFFNFVLSLRPFLQMKLFFWDNLIVLGKLSIFSTLQLQPHHAYTSKNAFSEKRSK